MSNVKRLDYGGQERRWRLEEPDGRGGWATWSAFVSLRNAFRVGGTVAGSRVVDNRDGTVVVPPRGSGEGWELI